MYIAILLGGILLDRIAKILVMQNMVIGEHFTAIPHILNIFYITNEGAAFSILEGKLWALLLISVLALVLLFFLWRFAQKESRMFRIAVVMVASGAIGNLIDRLLYGKVIDFLQFGFWTFFPIFNIADILIVVAAALIIIDLFVNDKKETADEHK